MKIQTSASIFPSAIGLLVIPLSKSNFKPKDSVLSTIQNHFGVAFYSLLKKRGLGTPGNNSYVIETASHKKVSGILFYLIDDSSKSLYEDLEKYRLLGHKIYRCSENLQVRSISLFCPKWFLKTEDQSRALLEGINFASYSFFKYKKKLKRNGIQKILLLNRTKTIPSKIVSYVSAIAAGTTSTKDLVNTPASDCKPRDLVAHAKKIAKNTSLKVQIYDSKQLKKLGAGALLSVANGSSEPPYLIKLTYKPNGKYKKHVALVGKGVTFDSGGLSMKPAAGMMDMKVDMAGAATVLGAMESIARIKPKVAVSAFVPTTENMINGKATRPGDIVKAINGKTIEILNTDAEGRLILADALCLASKDKPDTIIDLATLTGAIVVALGSEYAGLFCNNQKLQNDLVKSGILSGEHMWPMPLAPEYEEAIQSKIADIKNIGKGREAGSITAALFLQNFVDCPAWAHIDIAGVGSQSAASRYNDHGATGFGVNSLVNYVLTQE